MKEEIINYKNGGIRESCNTKPILKFIPPEALERLGYRYLFGFRKYGATDNFKKGLPVSNCIDSIYRHLLSYQKGENNEDNLSAILWNVCCIIHTELHQREFCDLETRINIMPEQCSGQYYYQQMEEKND